ncbi:ERF family protein [Streptomyces sp. NBC_00984]|uniref:ERF family protein n=1 Tax=Streptomyces sp. NBC_00984 TaxID=2903700 RepID=UPI0038668152|nr:ERF family protein [Streptomyces sp. NBC_00984]
MTVTALHPNPTAPLGPTPVRAPDVAYVPAPDGTPVDTPRVFTAIAAVMRDAMPVGKNQRNEQQNYKFRGIDDVMSAMAGPLRTHGVFILPTIADHQTQRDGKMTRTLITMRYRVYGPAGDCLVADVPGEAFDFADKSTNKAQSAALKYLLFTLFMLPVDGRSIDDGDRQHPEPSEEHRAERANQQQRRAQQRQQGSQQQNQRQERRIDRAEPGPQQQPARQGPGRDFIAEATAASTPQEFAKVRAAAVKAGAPADYLARLDAVAEQKRTAARHPQASASDLTRDASADAEAAEQALRLAASRAQLPTLDADFELVYGLPIEQATAQQLNTFRERIEAAGGAQ